MNLNSNPPHDVEAARRRVPAPHRQTRPITAASRSVPPTCAKHSDASRQTQRIYHAAITAFVNVRRNLQKRPTTHLAESFSRIMALIFSHRNALVMTKKGEKKNWFLTSDVLKTLGAASWWCSKTSPRTTVTEKSVSSCIPSVYLLFHSCGSKVKVTHRLYAQAHSFTRWVRL